MGVKLDKTQGEDLLAYVIREGFVLLGEPGFDHWRAEGIHMLIFAILRNEHLPVDMKCPRHGTSIILKSKGDRVITG